MKTKGNINAVIPSQFVVGTILVLGFISIFLNVTFVCAVLFKKSMRKPLLLNKFIIWFNAFMLLVESCYFFL